MTTSALHIGSSWIPITLFLPAGGLFLAALGKPDSRLRKISSWLLLLAFVSVFFTCGMGGASMRLAESLPGTNIPRLKVHAWTSLGALLASCAWLILLFYNRKKKSRSVDLTIMLFLVSFLVLYTWTIVEAIGIR